MLPYFGIFVWDFLWQGFIWFPLHMTMVWYLASRAGIPAPSDAIDVCVCKHQSALIRGDGDSQLHHRAAGLRTYATEQMSVRKQRASSDKQSVLSHSRRSEILKQGAKRCSEKLSDGWPKRLLAKFPYHCHMH